LVERTGNLIEPFVTVGVALVALVLSFRTVQMQRAERRAARYRSLVLDKALALVHNYEDRAGQLLGRLLAELEKLEGKGTIEVLRAELTKFSDSHREVLDECRLPILATVRAWKDTQLSEDTRKAFEDLEDINVEVEKVALAKTRRSDLRNIFHARCAKISEVLTRPC
jgi:hypothetical protein